MFTGIIEEIGTVVQVEKSGSNLLLSIEVSFVDELKVDQSVAHDGICLTVDQLNGKSYSVTVIQETIDKTNLSKLKVGGFVNLERSVKVNDRLDGHIVQGHVDQTGRCTKVLEQNGSWELSFEYDPSNFNITVGKGSICINGVSLTVTESNRNSFSVAIIPYTYENTNFNQLKVDDLVNIEFDIIGKYVQKILGNS